MKRKFNVGEKVRINMPTVNNDLHGKIGKVESNQGRDYPYSVRVGLFQYAFKENELEKFTPVEPGFTFDDIPQVKDFGITETDDVVNHPSHYTSDPSGVECITITRHRNFNIGNAFKYLWRNGLKDSVGKDKRAKQIEDLKKAVFYINDEITRLGGTP